MEAGEHFELIEQNFLTLEEAPGDLEILNAIFRSVHTIKGASGFLGLTKVQALAHIGENVLDDLRKGRMAVSPEVMELLFETEDMLKVLVNDVGVDLRKQGAPVDPDTSRPHRAPGGPEGRRQARRARSGPGRPPRRRRLALPEALADLDREAVQAAEEALQRGEAVLAMRIELLPAILGTPFNPLSMLPMVELVGRLVHSSTLMKPTRPGPVPPGRGALRPGS